MSSFTHFETKNFSAASESSRPVSGDHDLVQFGARFPLGRRGDGKSKPHGQIRFTAEHSRQLSGDGAGLSVVFGDRPWLILAALVTVYLVLGMLYESYIHPLTILSTLPSAGVGALLALLLFHTELSVIALVGIILLIGIVKKNAIMMIDFAVEAQRKEGGGTRGCDLSGLFAEVPADYDDHDVRLAWGIAAGAR